MSDQTNHEQEAEQAIEELEKTLQGFLLQERLICHYAKYVNPDDPETMAELQAGIEKIKAFNEEHKEARKAYELREAARNCE